MNQLWFESLSAVKGRHLRLFCFPYAGGNVHVFRKWQEHLPSRVDVCLVHLPGKGKRIGEAPFIRLKQLVEKIADVLVREPQQPCAFFGHSMGALISFELARELRRRKVIGPQHLFLSGCSAPGFRSRTRLIYRLPHDAFIEELRRLNGTPQELLDDPAMRELFLPALRADFEMIETHKCQPETPLSCPITVYGGRSDKEVSIEGLHAWAEQTSAGCTIRMFAGDHFFIHNPRIGLLNDISRHLT